MKTYRQAGVSIIELVIIFSLIGILTALVRPINNFSYVAATIIMNSMTAAEPLKKWVENYRLSHKKFPSIADGIHAPMLNSKLPDHIRAIQLSKNGSIVITYDTSDMDLDNLPFIYTNDLTDKSMILMPSFVDGSFYWDDCNFGNVPKRNRHYRCSNHK